VRKSDDLGKIPQRVIEETSIFFGIYIVKKKKTETQSESASIRRTTSEIAWKPGSQGN